MFNFCASTSCSNEKIKSKKPLLFSSRNVVKVPLEKQWQEEKTTGKIPFVTNKEFEFESAESDIIIIITSIT